MNINWDTPFRLPRAELSDRLHRVPAFATHSDLRAKLTRELLTYAESNQFVTVGGLVTMINVTIATHRTGLNVPRRRLLGTMLPVFFQQLTEVLLDDTDIRRVVLESLYETNGLSREEE